MKTIAVIVDYRTKSKPLPGIPTIIVDNTTNNVGFAAGVNRGIKTALKRGAETVLLINPDVKYRKLSPTVDITAPILKFKRDGKWVYDYGGKINWLLGRTAHIESLQGSTLRGKVEPYEIDYVSGAYMLIKREVFEKIGLFDERFFMYFEDADFCLRAKKAGFSVAVDTQTIVEHKLTKNKFKMQQVTKSNWQFIQKWVPIHFRPFAYIYWLFLYVRTVT